jgi:hypothetical protein
MEAHKASHQGEKQWCLWRLDYNDEELSRKSIVPVVCCPCNVLVLFAHCIGEQNRDTRISCHSSAACLHLLMFIVVGRECTVMIASRK